MDALASSERASQWTPAPTPSTAAHPDGLRATGTSTQKSEHGVLCAIRAATTLSVGPTSWDAVRERQVLHQKVLQARLQLPPPPVLGGIDPRLSGGKMCNADGIV